MPESLKWISVKTSAHKSELQVNQKVKLEVFKGYEEDCFNLISIFGAARQGKSFLMNCLAGQGGLFRISNQRDSCTQGIDISNYSLDVETFSTIYGNKKQSGAVKSSRIRVGFVDAEGQGDKDVTYDANLICPILLASKCVLFNWEDSLQKDRILNLLGIMHKAAINVATEGGLESDHVDTRIFGHLHLLFRDWQYGGDEEAVKKDIFKEERSADPAAAIRNQIRRSILESFESVTVWLFPPPVDNAVQLSTELRYDATCPAFRTKLAGLRSTLAQQLLTPTRFDGKELTGRLVGPMVETIATVLNAGESVRPASAYVSMLRMEVDRMRSTLEVSEMELEE